MSRQTIAILAGVVVLFVAVVIGTLAATSGGSGEPVHTLPGGQIHTGELETGPAQEDDDQGSMP